jgi:hypothetical protein
MEIFGFFDKFLSFLEIFGFFYFFIFLENFIFFEIFWIFWKNLDFCDLRSVEMFSRSRNIGGTQIGTT